MAGQSTINIKHPGALHRDLGVPEGQKIPSDKLASAKKSAESSGNNKELKRIQFAQNFGKATVNRLAERANG